MKITSTSEENTGRPPSPNAASGIGAGPAASAGGEGRQLWVDQVRTCMVMLVVNMHACCTYSHVGGWYVSEGADPGMAAKIPYFLWQGHLQAFFMGLLFFLGGHYAERSLARKGGAGFLRERARRLVLPALLYMLLIHPFIVVGLNPYGIPADGILPWLGRYYTSERVIAGNGPLWFALALFAFCVALAGWRSARPGNPERKALPSLGLLLGFGVAMALGTFLVRLWQPIGRNILNFQLCFFVQYVLAFAVGALSWRQGWLESLAKSRRAKALGFCGLLVGPLFQVSFMALLPPMGNPSAFEGGWNLAALLASFWEQLSGLCLGLGCLALFSRYFDRESRTSRWLSEHSFAVYVLHAPVLVALTMAFSDLRAPVSAKILLLTAGGLAGSYALAWAARKVPGLDRIL